MRKVTIYTDGACKGNPGKGGIGFILIDQSKKTLSGSQGYKNTTSNRMELTAAIIALQLLKYRCEIILYTDSKYLADSINKGWLEKWLSDPCFMNRKNEDLWKKLHAEIQKHEITIRWIKGHSNNAYNNLVDLLASCACNNNHTIKHNY